MKNQALVDKLYICAGQCTHCRDACMIEKHHENLLRCMTLDEDCADICRLTGQLLERNSESAGKFLKLCAEICIDCAIECEKHTHEHCILCAATCRQTAEMCVAYEEDFTAGNDQTTGKTETSA